MQCVGTVILVWQDMVGDTVNLERAVLNAVRITAWRALSSKRSRANTDITAYLELGRDMDVGYLHRTKTRCQNQGRYLAPHRQYRS